MNNYRSLLLICLIVLPVFITGCSDRDVSGDQPVAIESCFVKQGSCQCGPTSFYMIFKFYGDNRVDTGFWDLPDCGTEYSLKEDLSVVEKTSLVSRWLGVTCGLIDGEIIAGITIKNLNRKIMNLTADKVNPYYSVESNTDNSVDNSSQFAVINNSFLQQQVPVIIHLDRPSPYTGHFMILAGYDSASGIVYYMDPNKKESDPVLQSVSLTDFLDSNWYVSPDESSTNPDAYWDGTWIGFIHAE